MINKQELISKIQSVEGLSNEERSSLIELLRTRKKYGLVWEDKPEDVEEQLRNELPVFKEVKERAIVSDAPDAPNHILIEGDNLHALTALTYTHSGKIDVIYIDPPYNTGNNDFVYNDKFVDKEDSYRHSKWLSFMNKRLKIAKQLLSDKGVIFISIDDNEQSQLKMLCDEIFGEQKFVGEIVWFKKRKGSFLSNKLVSMTEYILPYWNGKEAQLFGGLPSNSESQPIIKRTNSTRWRN
jgi:adenine-specific DNA-methyltransferase